MDAVREMPGVTTAKAGKNIVICCDGTGNEFGQSNSNVVKLYTAIAIDNEQVGYYHPGVGTMGDPAQDTSAARWWSKVKGLAFGGGFKDNVFDAYRTLMNLYDDEDRVFLFGFSRGAYTVRALAGLLDGYGLLCRGNEGHLPYAWRLYVAQHQNRSRTHLDHNENFAKPFKEAFSHKDFSVHFMGVWDTVSSVGWVTTPLRLFNVAQNETLRTVRHAISLDERRCYFMSNQYGAPLPGQDVLQMWFAGVHSDVGGSYAQDESVLSNISLEWMLNEARNTGLVTVPDRVNMVLGRPSTTYPANAPLYTAPTKWLVHKSLHGVWWLAELLPHRFYNQDVESKGEEIYRIPLGAYRSVPVGSLLHESVRGWLTSRAVKYTPGNFALDDLQTETYAGTLAPENSRTMDVYRPAQPPKVNHAARYAVLALFFVLYAVLLGLVVWGVWALVCRVLHT